MADFDIYSPGDVFDSRDVIERFEELDAEHGALQDAIDKAAEVLDDCRNTEQAAGEDDGGTSETVLQADFELTLAEEAMETWTEYDEYAALKKFVESANGYGDWDHGETFIADSYFEEYAEEIAEDVVGRDVIQNATWPLNCIDWEAAADQLKQDYTSYEIEGKTYWARS
jgi:hypothetical protein